MSTLFGRTFTPCHLFSCCLYFISLSGFIKKLTATKLNLIIGGVIIANVLVNGFKNMPPTLFIYLFENKEHFLLHCNYFQIVRITLMQNVSDLIRLNLLNFPNLII